MKHGLNSSKKKITVRKRAINADSLEEFRDISLEMYLGNLYLNPNDAWKYFSKVFSGVYDLAVPLKTMSVQRKTLQNLWMTEGLLKPSKRKQNIEIHKMKHL